MGPRDCFFCLKRILIFIYNTYYKNIYIIYSIYTLVILEFWIGFLPSGLTRRPSGWRDGIQYEARRHTPSSVVNRARAKLVFSIGFGSMAFGLVGVLMIKREMIEYADMEMYASWRKGCYVCRSNKFILCCVNDQRGLTKLTPEQIREMYLSTR